VIPAVAPSVPPAASALEKLILLGQDYYGGGRIGEAIAAYQAGLDVAAAAPDRVTVATIARLHADLGNAYMVCGDLNSAAASYKAALRLAPNLTACWCNLGNVRLQIGHAQEAIALYLQALKIAPAHWPSRTNLAQALMTTRQYLVAKGLLLELSEERPQDGKVRHQLGKVCHELNETEAALSHFQAAISLNPVDADSLYWIGALRQKLGDLEGAQAAYAQAAQIEPLIRRRAVKSPPDFRVLALYAPFAGNTPAEFLFKNAAYDADTLALLGADEPDLGLLGDIQIVVNLISDADQGGAVLSAAARLAERLGKPVINDPSRIERTTRDAIAGLLSGIAGCRIPRILRIAAGSDVSAAALAAQLPFAFPVLARPAGTHGGDDFEKIENLAALADFLRERPDGDHYVIEYVDYASADGHFRKYRFIFVGEEVLSYHLAIGNGWKVHHASTDMANQPWMQQEESAFLSDPHAVFAPSHYQALHAIRERIGLDYFGIDCALDGAGDLIVFEVNASMLVHEDNAEFPYKDAYVHAIKAAFDAMLRRRAGLD
jgi:tetratricopeptide (TPR) repeat protein/glutathione synthase/RimK-type ligase-like ATP-grasp enzyme